MTRMNKSTKSYAASRMRAATNTFTIGEMAALLELLRVARRGGDTRVIMRSSPITNIERKFQKMLVSTEARVALGETEPTSSDTE